MSPKPKLHVEPLEAREVPAVFGNPWPNAGSLTMSFAPDWTVVAGYSQDALGWGQPSRLFSEMSGAGTTAQWQTEILRAFQTWAVNTNINIGLVPDGGSPFGPMSAAPGAGSSGQIRVGAFLVSSEVIAVNQAFSPLSGAWGGDLLFNTAQNYSIGAQSGKFDIFTVALNEAGNIFGLADSNDPTSALYGHYIGAKTGLIASDVAAVQALYGSRAPDAFEVDEDDELGDTYFLDPFAAPTDATKTMVAATGADLTTLADVDHYKFKVPDGNTSLTVRLETVGKSLLKAKISVYNDQGVVVGTATSAGPQAMQDIVLTVNGVTAGKDYTVRVEKAGNDVFGIGKYDLKVGYNFDPIVPSSATTVSYTADSGTNETIAKASTLSPVNGSVNKQYVLNAAISSAADVDFYKFSSPSATPNPLTITITPAQAYGLYTKVTVYDSNKNVVPSEVLANGIDGRLVVQVANPVASRTYYLKVESVGRNGFGLTGNYTLAVDFTLAAVPMSTVATKTLTAARATDYTTFAVPEAKLFHFTLGATTTNTAVASGVRMIVYNASYQIVATFTADAGGTSSGAIFLNAGTYYIKFEAATKSGAPLSNLTYTLRTVVLSDPIDPYAPPDPTALPPLPPPPPPDYTTTTQSDPYYAALPLIDPWADPWQP